MEPVDKNKVLFAGEATHLEQYASVHRAYLTGMREAERLLKLFDCNGLCRVML